MCEEVTAVCHGDGFFLLMKRMRMPETSTPIVDQTIGLNECKERCSKDCNCTGFANKDIQNGGSGCVIWTGGAHGYEELRRRRSRSICQNRPL